MENVAEPIVEVSKVFNLSMEHDTANHTWTQKIDPFTVFVDLKNKVIKTFKNGKEIESKSTTAIGNVKANKAIFTLRNEYFDAVE